MTLLLCAPFCRRWFFSHRSCRPMIRAVIDVVPGMSPVSLTHSLVARFPIGDGVIAQRDMILIASADLTKTLAIRPAHNSDRAVFEPLNPALHSHRTAPSSASRCLAEALLLAFQTALSTCCSLTARRYSPKHRHTYMDRSP